MKYSYNNNDNNKQLCLYSYDLAYSLVLTTQFWGSL